MAIKTDITAVAAVKMLMAYPFWTELYYSVQVIEENNPAVCSTAGTDGRVLLVHPPFWNGLSSEDRVTVLMHELAHKMLLHPFRRGMRHPVVWNIAADHVINLLLTAEGRSEPKIGWLCDQRFAGLSTERVYDLLMQEADGDPSKVPGVGDMIADIMEPSSEAEREAGEQSAIETVNRATMMAKAMGREPGFAKELSAATAPKPEAWFSRLQRYMLALKGRGYNWSRLDRRRLVYEKILAPADIAESLGEIVVAIDASGSVYNAADQANFSGHINGILSETRPERVHVIYFDSRVTKTEVIEGGDLDFSSRPKGGGGTCFEPIFQEIEEQGLEPVVTIVLTDLMGSFPAREPEYPVIWASIYHDATAPFGETIYVE